MEKVIITQAARIPVAACIHNFNVWFSVKETTFMKPARFFRLG